MWRKQGLIDDDIAWITEGVVEVGTHTFTTLNNLILHLAGNPRIQHAAHEELMRVVGPNRTPVYDDIKDLPHFADADVTYKEYVISKGTVLLANTSFMHYDPRRYDEPFELKPERYLGHPKSSAEYATESEPYKRDHFAFGARLGENTLNIALSNILWAFEIRPPVVDGVEQQGIDLSDEAFDEMSFRGPKPFVIGFVPREDRLAFVEKQWKQAKQEGYVLRGNEVNVDSVVIH